jgi:signal transduction histidine kinase
MRERVEAQGGRFAIHSMPDGGVMVSAVIPVDATAPEGV